MFDSERSTDSWIRLYFLLKTKAVDQRGFSVTRPAATPAELIGEESWPDTTTQDAVAIAQVFNTAVLEHLAGPCLETWAQETALLSNEPEGRIGPYVGNRSLWRTLARATLELAYVHAPLPPCEVVQSAFHQLEIPAVVISEDPAFGPADRAAFMPASGLLDKVLRDSGATIIGRPTHEREPRRVRNASAWAVKTPGVIADEIATTDTDVRSLSRDIWNKFRESFHDAQVRAEQRFEYELGRKPQGRDDYQRVYGWMHPVPSAVDIEVKSYQGRFVEEWERFASEWGEFVASHKRWYERVWGGVYDKVIEFRERLVKWRERFESLGGVPTSPAPTIPPDTNPFSLGKPLVWIGLGAAALTLGYWFFKARKPS